MGTTGAPLHHALLAPTVTVTGAATLLLTLIRAKGGIYANTPGSCRSWTVQADSTNGDDVLIGDENVAISPQNCGLILVPGGTDLDRSSTPAQIPLGSIYVLAASGSQLLNVIILAQ